MLLWFQPSLLAKTMHAKKEVVPLFSHKRVRWINDCTGEGRPCTYLQMFLSMGVQACISGFVGGCICSGSLT